MTFPLDAPLINPGADDPGNRPHPLRTGVWLHIRPTDVTYQHEIQRTVPTTSDGSVAQSTAYATIAMLPVGRRDLFDRLPLDGKARFYRYRATREGYEGGDWSTHVRAIPVPLSNRRLDLLQQYQDEGRDRNDTLWDGDARLNNGVSVKDESGLSGINRHNETGLAQDGETVSFIRAYKNPPEVSFTLECGRTVLLTSGSTDDQFQDMRALELTTTGFQLSAKIITGPGTTLEIDGFSTAQSTTTDPENGDETLTLEGDEVWSTLQNASSGSAATYQVYLDAFGSFMTSTEIATVGIWTSTGNGSTSYTFRTSKQYENTDTVDDKLQFAATLGENYAIRAVLNYSGTPSPANRAIILMHGEDNSKPGVQWLRSTAGDEETMTPNSGDRVRWHAMEAP